MELFALIIGVAFAIMYYQIYVAGTKAMDKGANAAEKEVKKASEKLKPVITKTKEKIEQAKEGIFHPNTFAKVWTFTMFVDTYGPHVGLVSHTNGVTGKVFFTCEVSDSSGRTKSIRFSSQLGELNAKELSDRKDSLYIGQTNSGKYYLYDKNFKAWEDVDLSNNKGEE